MSETSKRIEEALARERLRERVTTVGALLLAALLLLAWFLSDFYAGLLLSLFGVLTPLFTALKQDFPRLVGSQRQKNLIFTVCYAACVLFPVGQTLFPGEVLLRGFVRETGDAVSLQSLPESGSYLVIVGASISPNGGDTTLTYLLDSQNLSGERIVFTGSISREKQKVKGNTSPSVELHSRDKAVLQLSRERTLTLRTSLDTKQLPEGLTVSVYKAPLQLRWFSFFMILFLFSFLLYDAKVSEAAGKGYLAIGGAMSLLTSLCFSSWAVPYHPLRETGEIARQAFASVMVGSFGGILFGLLLSFLLKRLVPVREETQKAREDVLL